jgi:hypothetical protein
MQPLHWAFIVIILCTSLAFIAYLFYCHICREKYANSPLLVYQVETNDKSLDVEIQANNDSDTVQKKLSDIKNIRVNGATNSVFLTDAFSFSQSGQSQQVRLITVVPDEKILMIMKPQDNINNESFIDIILQDKAIGYINDIDASMIKCVASSLKGSGDKVLNLVKVDGLNGALGKTLFDTNNIYCLVMFTSLSSKIVRSIPKQFKIDFINYEDIDINKLKVLIPFAKTRDIDLAIYFPSFKGTFTSKYCLVIDMMLVGISALEDEKDLNLELNQLIVRMGQPEANGYYTMFFTPMNQTISYIRKVNEHIIAREDMPILEQFEERFNIKATTNVPGFYENGTFTMSLEKINGLPLTLHSRVELMGQDRQEENGSYIVKQVTSTETVMQKFLIYKKDVVDDGPTNIDVTLEKDIDGVPLNEVTDQDIVYIVTLKKYARLRKRTPIIYLELLDTDSRNHENPTYDTRYECYDQPLIKSRGLCESKYDAMGLSPKPEMYWDRRCERNEECPFYQANKNYKNYYGGCIDGYCQMPVGVKQMSYRKFDPDTKPFCYGCKDEQNAICCEEQKDKEKYPNLKSPDYAFPLDQYARLMQSKSK